MDTDVYVGNLGSKLTEENLRAAFVAAGCPVKKVVILRSPQNDRSRGFGFVRVDSEEAAEVVIRSMNGVEVGGQALKVGASRERPQPRGRSSARRLDDDGGYSGGGERRGPPRRR